MNSGSAEYFTLNRIHRAAGSRFKPPGVPLTDNYCNTIPSSSKFEFFDFGPPCTESIMSSSLISRAFTNVLRQIGRSKPSLYHRAKQREASSKHPRGFVPPKTEDLVELRERVQEFTRKSRWRLGTSVEAEDSYRQGNRGRSRREDR